jgi:hypothetical protein
MFDSFVIHAHTHTRTHTRTYLVQFDNCFVSSKENKFNILISSMPTNFTMNHVFRPPMYL